MKALLNDELRQALQNNGDAPLELEDQQTKRIYYLVSREQFERFRELLGMDQTDPSLYEFTDEVLYEDSPRSAKPAS